MHKTHYVVIWGISCELLKTQIWYWNDFYSNGIYTWSHTMEHLASRADLNYTCKIICMFVNCWKLKYDIWFIFIKIIYKAMWYIWSHHATLCSSSRPQLHVQFYMYVCIMCNVGFQSSIELMFCLLICYTDFK